MGGVRLEQNVQGVFRRENAGEKMDAGFEGSQVPPRVFCFNSQCSRFNAIPGMEECEGMEARPTFEHIHFIA